MKGLKGRISDEPSGIYIDLPKNWTAFPVPRDNMFIMAANKEIGGLIFSVTHYAKLERGDGKLRHIITDEVIDIEYEQDGDYNTYSYDISETKVMHAWETDTDRYFIRFLYICDKDKVDKEIETVRQILKTLVKDPEKAQ